MRLNKIDLSVFKKAIDGMIAIKSNVSYRPSVDRITGNTLAEYTAEEIESVIVGNDPGSMSALSRYYFNKTGYYKRIILYYAHLLTYAYLITPHLKTNQKVSNKNKKIYYNVLDFVEELNLKSFSERVATNVLIDGAYYGLIIKNNNKITFMDLPFNYCRTRFKGLSGLNVIELNLSYFKEYKTSDELSSVLKLFPKEVKSAYNNYIAGKGPRSCIIPEGIGCYFNIYENRPCFINVIESVEDFLTYKQLEINKEELETKKILVQKIPIGKDDEMIFEPPEAEELHRGAVYMLKDNRGLDVLTSYADVTVESLSDNRQTVNSNLESFQNMIYSEGGVSRNIFAATGENSLDQSLKNDLSLMMNLADQISLFFSFLINSEFENNSISFNLNILPISYYNSQEYIDETYKLAGGGYSILLPAIASGLSQKQFNDVKILENDFLEVEKIMIPIAIASTQSGKVSNTGEDGSDGGAPSKKSSDKKEETLKYEGEE